MNHVRRSVKFAVAFALAAGVAGCNMAALVKPQAEKILTVQGEKTATLNHLSDAAKEVNFKHVSINSKGYVTGSRGMGYSESTYLQAEVKEDGSALKVTVRMKSSGSAQEALDQVVAAFSKRVSVQ